ncbi:MAG: Excinuclease ABC C subunit domain protein [Candidatus Moranbacteria bacterium GW2011_GWC2_37_8]|nr:MAG: Excinuclease ABC C subunit domain protein [Candidatus Moranbacteria bacterium GW2011_GWC2_37_8]KKQ63361.1 MAG: Excinuclease ABC C subunit domain protein [Parcubacteria group bacterium GW2011_GWC1_38_22]
MFSTYVLENPNAKKYTGSTNNLEERLSFHNDIFLEKAKFHRTTYKKGPWHVIFSKEFATREEALKFERFLKTGKGREWLERARHGG